MSPPASTAGGAAVAGVRTDVGRRRDSGPTPLPDADPQSRSLPDGSSYDRTISALPLFDQLCASVASAVSSGADSCSQPITVSAAPSEPTTPRHERLLRGRDGGPRILAVHPFGSKSRRTGNVVAARRADLQPRSSRHRCQSPRTPPSPSNATANRATESRERDQTHSNRDDTTQA